MAGSNIFYDNIDGWQKYDGQANIVNPSWTDYLTNAGSVASQALSNIGSYMQKHPNETAIILDTLGSKLAPNNPFAGIGQQIGRSNILARKNEEMNKRTAEERKASIDYRNAVAALLGSNFTKKELPGVTSATISPIDGSNAREVSFKVTLPTGSGKDPNTVKQPAGLVPVGYERGTNRRIFRTPDGELVTIE